ncbi:alpha/beta hydrolase [Acinetobacter sp. SwsAc6]|uniref:alpha/beta fold hydrolase n=1 Tax=Acinetobacter sp. SwsAc6 TaxID=2749439 RepID=UPI0015BA6AB2|nr:alpha/beta hydrolase [Acinetobacter sp. SwsAc6]NWK75276.1 alpha/beta hydrolase [Acinetobacter sp. SwsAc6]
MPYYHMPDGEQLFVRRYGQGEPVLVLSGLGIQSWQWHPFLYPHHKKFEFIIPDWRGFGGSKQCKIPHLDAISSHWRDIEALLPQLNLPQFKVIAYSMGATTAMHGMQYGQFHRSIQQYLHIDQTPKISADQSWPFGLFGEKHTQFIEILQQISQVLKANPDAKAMPDLKSADRQRLLNSWLAFIDLQAGSKDAKAMPDLKSADRQRLLNSWLAFIDLQAGSKIAPFLIKQALKYPRLQAHVLPIQRLDYLSWYIHNYLEHQEDYREALTQLTCPVTFFIGAESKLYPAEGQQQIANTIPQAQQVIFKKSGHTPLLSEPLKFASEIGRFLHAHDA